MLRSKEIEVSGFNGTAVFKEVRVQSIVVEFILTHVPQLFAEQGKTQAWQWDKTAILVHFIYSVENAEQIWAARCLEPGLERSQAHAL